MPKLEKILVLFQILNFAAAAKQTQPAQQSYKVLPLMYIEHQDQFTQPTSILRGAKVPNGQSFSVTTIFKSGEFEGQLPFCPSPTDEHKAQITKSLDLFEKFPGFEEYTENLKLSEHCLFETYNFKVNDPYSCAQEPVPVLRKITKNINHQEADQHCGPDDAGQSYEFFYVACPTMNFARRTNLLRKIREKPDAIKFIQGLSFIALKNTSFEFCYDHQKKETIYTKHQLNTVKLFFQESMKFEREKEYPMSTDNYEYFDTDFEQIKTIYERENDPGADVQSDDETASPRSIQYKAQKLVPAENMPFALWKKPTFHFLNVKPMQTDLIQLWKFIDEVIIENYKDHPVSLNIHTGAFPAPESNLPIEYMFNNQIEIPQIWVKLISFENEKTSSTQGMVITMKNYISNDNKDCPKNICDPYIAQGTVGQKFPQSVNQICCSGVTEEYLKMFNIQLQTDYLLTIKNLTY